MRMGVDYVGALRDLRHRMGYGGDHDHAKKGMLLS